MLDLLSEMDLSTLDVSVSLVVWLSLRRSLGIKGMQGLVQKGMKWVLRLVLYVTIDVETCSRCDTITVQRCLVKCWRNRNSLGYWVGFNLGAHKRWRTIKSKLHILVKIKGWDEDLCCVFLMFWLNLLVAWIVRQHLFVNPKWLNRLLKWHSIWKVFISVGILAFWFEVLVIIAVGYVYFCHK